MDLVLDTAGRVVSSTMLATAMDRFDQLREYQLRQSGEHSYRLLVAGAEGVYALEELRHALIGLLGSGTRVTVEPVADIPPEANGKFRVMVPLPHADAMDGEPSSPVKQASEETARG
jgi:hypothetical protein